MAGIGRNLKKQGVIMTLLSLVLMNTGCEEQIDPANIPSEGGEMVEVSLNIGFADEADGATLSATPSTKSNQASGRQSAFDMQLLPTAQTKAASNYPNKLYNLEIYQYRTDGSYITYSPLGTKEIGESLGTFLDDNSGNECQLLIVARGATQAVASLSGKSLSEVREITANAATIEKISATDETGTDINNMPYLLYLPKVIISNGKLISPAGTDVRLLLKRLAVGLTINWNFNVDGYTLSEVRLMQVPKDYRILPATEKIDPYGTMYPTSVSEFVDGFRLKGATLTNAGGNNGSQTLWMPANARGTRNDVTYPTYRNKNYAHSAATYVEFVVDRNGERLLYRAYLGGNTTSDFNLLENTNYNWTINLYNANYTGDPRIQLLDLKPVVSTNLQTTSNCFMMKPGTNICFNPYKHEAGTGGWNTCLAPGGAISKTIDKVKVLWQSKDAGTTGNLVLGYVADSDADNHTNLVNFTGSTAENARIHVKVPNTNGGNAVIAAYSGTAIVWSWHLWITDYVPAKMETVTTDAEQTAALSIAEAATAQGSVHQYGGTAWATNGAFFGKVLMDRNLGAIRNTYSITNTLDAARAYGNLYQWGRKDPLPGSVDGSNKEIDVIFDGDGVSFSIGKNTGGNLENTILYPTNFYIRLSLADNSWGADAKSIYDPCPSGWRVPDFTNNDTKNIFKNFSEGNDGSIQFLIANNWQKSSISSSAVTPQTFAVSNGFLYNNSVWFPSFRLRESSSGNLRDPWSDGSFAPTLLPSFSMFGARAGTSGFGWYIEFKVTGIGSGPASGIAAKGYGMSVRCVQQ